MSAAENTGRIIEDMGQLPVDIRTIADDEYEVLEAVENDADRLLIDTLHPTRWDPAPPGVTRRGHDGVVLIADEAAVGHGDIAGFVDMRYIDGVTGYIETLAVRRRSMRQGIGRRLLREAAARATNDGIDVLTLRTYRSIAFNGPFYASEGFSVCTPPEGAQWATNVLDSEDAAGLPRPDDRIFMRLLLGPAR